ncbi:DUF1540 domain-containing protein [Clostridium paraputrificum]|uniref:DUF1540 domain-containing protein n=1 Tax=Clostridium TaxID=1485 RepID=UPI003D33DDC4
MTHLNCCVESCAHNKDEYCCLSSIEVGGSNASKPTSTCCDSFAENSGGFTNAAESVEPHLDIQCKAEECVHNSNCYCSAEHVDIAGISACNPEETLCATFHCE